MKKSLWKLSFFIGLHMCCIFLPIVLLPLCLYLILSGTPVFSAGALTIFSVLLPFYLSISGKEEKESDTGLSQLYTRYRYSKSSFLSYGLSYGICTILMLLWHITQGTLVQLYGCSVPFALLILMLVALPITATVTYLVLHHRLMNGIL